MSVLYCPNCYSVKHTLSKAIIGFIAWQLWRVLPQRMAFKRLGLAVLPYAGDWLWDTRGCGCNVPLETGAA